MNRTFTLFTEAVKGGIGANTNKFHYHLTTHNERAGGQRTIPLRNLNDLKDHHELLSHPHTSAHLYVGIGDAASHRQANEFARHGFTAPGHFKTHVHLRKDSGSTTFVPSFMHVADDQQRKGWGHTLWNHLDRKLKGAGLDLDHDWDNQTSAGHAWSRKTSGRGRGVEMAATPEGWTKETPTNHELDGRVDRESEWHHLTGEQKQAFRAHADPLLTKGKGTFTDPTPQHEKGMFGDPEIRAVRTQMKRKHGVDLHPYTIANAMHHIGGGGLYGSGYTGSTPMHDLRNKFLDFKSTIFDRYHHKMAKAQRRTAPPAPSGVPVRSSLVKEKAKKEKAK